MAIAEGKKRYISGKIPVVSVVIIFSLLNMGYFAFTDERMMMDFQRFIQRLQSVNDEHGVDKRFEKVKAMIRNSRQVGYVTDRTNWDIQFDTNALAAYYLAQYGLAPIVVENSDSPELLIGNFDGALARPSVQIHIDKYDIVKEFNDGVFLLQHK